MIVQLHFISRTINASSDMAGNRNVRRGKARLRTTKVLDRLTFSPRKHKMKETRKRLKAMQDRPQQAVQSSPPVQEPTIKFGSFNINGMSSETGWAVEELLRTRNFDVRKIY